MALAAEDMSHMMVLEPLSHESEQSDQVPCA